MADESEEPKIHGWYETEQGAPMAAVTAALEMKTCDPNGVVLSSMERTVDALVSLSSGRVFLEVGALVRVLEVSNVPGEGLGEGLLLAITRVQAYAIDAHDQLIRASKINLQRPKR